MLRATPVNRSVMHFQSAWCKVKRSGVINDLALQLCSRCGQRQQPGAVIRRAREKQEGERVQHSSAGHFLQQPLLLVRFSSCK